MENELSFSLLPYLKKNQWNNVVYCLLLEALFFNFFFFNEERWKMASWLSPLEAARDEKVIDNPRKLHAPA